jgi:hypothetical protein
MNVTMRRVYRLLPVPLLLAAAGSASAANLAAGTVPFSFNMVSANNNTLSPTTQFTVGSVVANGNGTGSFDCTTPGADSVCTGYDATLSPNPFQGNGLVGEILIFDGGAANGTPEYQYKVTSQVAPSIFSIGSETFYNIETLGQFSDLRSSGGFTPNGGSLSITITENCAGVNCSFSGGASFATPPALTVSSPEPTTRALFLGSALVGLGLLSRKRKRKA